MLDIHKGLKVVLFCENQYAISILQPIESEIRRLKAVGYDVLWFVDTRHIHDFPSKSHSRWTNSIQEIYDFSPDVLFVPGNIVPYYLPGVKVQIFHGYAGEKKGHWDIRHYFDLYLTQGPFFTAGFKALAEKYKDFEVKETGWSRQDWVVHHLHAFDDEKNRLLAASQRKYLVLFAPTFSPSLTSLPYIKQGLIDLSQERNVLILIKLHPLTKQRWVDEYKKLASEHAHILWVDDHYVSKYQLMADVLISDTSSSVYEFLLLDKPVITYQTTAKNTFWHDMKKSELITEAYDRALRDDTSYKEKRQWVIDNYDPYLDGNVCRNMLMAVHDYIMRNGVPKKRKINLWRKYQSIKTFGFIKKNSKGT